MSIVFTSHWRSPLLAEVDAVPVSISRGRPRWPLPFTYRRYDELAPCDEAWNAADREAYAAAYRAQLECIGAQTIMGRLEEIGGGKPTICLCWERLADPGEWCHRRMLAAFLREQAGAEAPELKAGDLPQREDAPEMRLF